LGQQPLSIIEIMKQVSEGKIKITPDIVVSGGGDGAANNVLSAFIASMMAGGVKLASAASTPATVPEIKS
jgi:diacylglycerol kinase family enzyme